MLQRANAIFTALLIVTYMCFPVFSVFAKDAEADTFAMSGVKAATDATTATDGATDGSQDEDRIASLADLEQWIEDNNHSGKTVTFSDTIIIPAGLFVWMSGVTLDTANHGLVIEGTINLIGVTIIGKGTENPVITIANSGSLEIRAKQSEITSDGTAVKIENDGTFYVPTGWCSIRADAVGIEAEGGLELLSDTSIISKDTGVLAGGDVKLFLCDIDAPNPIEATGSVILDTCLVSEPIEGTTVLKSKILGIPEQRQEILYSMLPLGGDTASLGFIDELEVDLDGGKQTLPVSWDTSLIDTDKAGEYKVTFTILSPYDRFELESENPIEAVVEVVDASVPVFYEMVPATRGSYWLRFLYNTDNPNDLTLLHSDDEGEEWLDYTENAEIELSDGILSLKYSEYSETPVLLVFKVDGVGESQILRIIWDDDGVHSIRGGDRNGGDRGENTLPGVTPPDTTPPKSSTTSRERPSTTYDKSYESAETANSNEISEPVTGSEIPEIINGNEQSAPPTTTGESSPSQSPPKPYTEAAADTPEAPDTATPDAESEQFEAVPTAAMQDVADASIAEVNDKTENTQGSKPLSDTVIPIVAVSTVGLLGAGTYLGVAGKLSLHSLIKMLAGWLGI